VERLIKHLEDKCKIIKKSKRIFSINHSKKALFIFIGHTLQKTGQVKIIDGDRRK
jgi:ribosomal protein L36